jgi:Winged helix-turn helix
LSAAAGQTDEAIAATVQVGTSTVYRTKRRFVEESLEAALSEDPRPGGKRKLTGSEEALLIAAVCSTPPEGPGALDAGALGRGGSGVDPARAGVTPHHWATTGGKRSQAVAAEDVVRPED